MEMLLSKCTGQKCPYKLASIHTSTIKEQIRSCFNFLCYAGHLLGCFGLTTNFNCKPWPFASCLAFALKTQQKLIQMIVLRSRLQPWKAYKPEWCI